MDDLFVSLLQPDLGVPAGQLMSDRHCDCYDCQCDCDTTPCDQAPGF